MTATARTIVRTVTIGTRVSFYLAIANSLCCADLMMNVCRIDVAILIEIQRMAGPGCEDGELDPVDLLWIDVCRCE